MEGLPFEQIEQKCPGIPAVGMRRIGNTLDCPV
jgi:hypothetical protein